MKDSGRYTVDLIQDLTLLDLYADNAPVPIVVDDWGNEWEASSSMDIDYRIVDE